MANPFKQFLPEEEFPKNEIEEQVMSSIHMKTHLVGILEFFLAILGLTTESSLNVEPESGTLKTRKDQDEPDFFF